MVIDIVACRLPDAVKHGISGHSLVVIGKKEARRAGQVIALSSLENRILDLLFTNHDKAVSRLSLIHIYLPRTEILKDATGKLADFLSSYKQK